MPEATGECHAAVAVVLAVAIVLGAAVAPAAALVAVVLPWPPC